MADETNVEEVGSETPLVCDYLIHWSAERGNGHNAHGTRTVTLTDKPFNVEALIEVRDKLRVEYGYPSLNVLAFSKFDE